MNGEIYVAENSASTTCVTCKLEIPCVEEIRRPLQAVLHSTATTRCKLSDNTIHLTATPTGHTLDHSTTLCANKASYYGQL